MDAYGRLLDALCVSQETWNWNTRRAQSRPLLCFLIEFLGHPEMPQVANDRVNEEATALMHVSHPRICPNCPLLTRNYAPGSPSSKLTNTTRTKHVPWDCHACTGR